MSTPDEARTRCTKCPDTDRMFCPLCGRVADVAALRAVCLLGFIGPGSLNPRVERFWETGDPEVFDRP